MTDTVAGGSVPYGAHVTFPVRSDDVSRVVELLLRAAAALEADSSCRLYLVGRPVDNPDAVSVTEVWDDEAAHAASLDRLAVRAIIDQVVPMLAGKPTAAAFRPVGGLEHRGGV